MIEFKQIVGRGTRIHEDAGKLWFTIMDFRKATELFADPAFDGEPVVVYEPGGGEPPVPPDDETGEGGDDGGPNRRPRPAARRHDEVRHQRRPRHGRRRARPVLRQ